MIKEMEVRVFAAFWAVLAMWFAGSGSVLAQSSNPPPITLSELEAKARSACQGDVTIAPNAMRRLHMDGDDLVDVVFNWGQVTCQSASAMKRKGAGFCGMHNCSIDIYLSSQYRPGGWPKAVMNHREKPFGLAGAALRTSTQGGSCRGAQLCYWEWRWDGSELQSTKMSSNNPSGPASVPITAENLTGIWGIASSSCANDYMTAFKAGGEYASYEENGDWRLIGNRIAVVVRETYIMGDADSIRPVAEPKPLMLQVATLTADRLAIRRLDGSKAYFRRCD